MGQEYKEHNGTGLWRFTCDGPRWLGLESLIKDQCFELGLECWIDVDKGFLRHHYRVEIKGDSVVVEKCKARINLAIDVLNGDK